jgi:hypothetical protein
VEAAPEPAYPIPHTHTQAKQSAPPRMSSRRRTNKFVGQRLEILFDDNVWCTGMICEHSSIRDNYGIYFDCDRTMCTYKLGHVRMNCSHKWPIRIITAALRRRRIGCQLKDQRRRRACFCSSQPQLRQMMCDTVSR